MYDQQAWLENLNEAIDIVNDTAIMQEIINQQLEAGDELYLNLARYNTVGLEEMFIVNFRHEKENKLLAIYDGGRVIEFQEKILNQLNRLKNKINKGDY